MDEPNGGRLLPDDEFSIALSKLQHLPDVTGAGPTTVQTVTFYGRAETYIVQTLRQAEVGDTIFLTRVDSTGAVRVVIPPKVALAILRQQDSITGKNRRKGARAAVQTRAEKGIVPGFLKNPGKGGRKKKRRVKRSPTV